MKVCSKCGESKPLDQYYKKKKSKDGIDWACKACCAQYRRLKGREYFRAFEAAWEAGNKGRRKENYRKWARENKAAREQYKRAWLDKNGGTAEYKEKCLLYAKKYRDLNKAAFAVYDQKKRALKKQLLSTFTEEGWKACLGHFGHKCAYCGGEKQLTQDHFVPVSKKGPYVEGNIVPACVGCNSSKGKKDFFDWYPGFKHQDAHRQEIILKYIGILP